MKINLRRMQIKDIPAVLQLGQVAPGTAVTKETSFWTKKELQGWITQSNDPS